MKTLSPMELGKLVWRRKLWIVIPTVAGLIAGAVAVRLLPPTYRASTLILVESQRIPTTYVKATVTSSLGERLQTIEQQITSRDNLERLVTEMNLYPDLVGQGQIEQAIGRARRALTLQVQSSTIFRIFFKADTPYLAAETANLVAEGFIEQNLALREGQAQSTSDFLESELDETKRQLEDQEARVTRFRLRNDGLLPEQRDGNLRAIALLQTKLDINLDSIENAEVRKLLLEKEAEAVGDGVAARPRTRNRLEELRLEYARMSSRYTSRHPDMVRLKKEIETLERTAADRGDEEEAPGSALSPELQAVFLDIRRLEEERGRILDEIELYQRRIEMSPRIEQELVSLTRDYDNVKESYNSLLRKRLDARLAENLEKSRQSEQFRILERALPPKQPFAPNRFFLMALGLGAGFVVGLGLVILREEMDQTYLDSEALTKAFPGVKVLATVPLIQVKQKASESQTEEPRRTTA